MGEWALISTDDPIQDWGLHNDWEYDTILNSDGTGVEWWHSPGSGWHILSMFNWSTSNGNLTMTIIDFNADVVLRYLGQDYVDAFNAMIGVPSIAGYSISGDGNTLTLTSHGISSMYTRIIN